MPANFDISYTLRMEDQSEKVMYLLGIGFTPKSEYDKKKIDRGYGDITLIGINLGFTEKLLNEICDVFGEVLYKDMTFWVGGNG